jgi:hypothetical protein
MAHEEPSEPTTINATTEKYETKIMEIPGVTGIGIGDNDRKKGLSIKVYVARLTPEVRKVIPQELDGYPVIPEATGEFEAF